MRTLIVLLLSLILALPLAGTTVINRGKPGISAENAHQPLLQSTPLPGAAPTVYLLDEDFDGSFPPAGWTVVNPDGGRTWERTTAASGYASGTASTRVRFYDYTPNGGQADSLISPPVTGLQATDSLSFDYAYVPIPSASVGPDTVEVYLSTDGGATYPFLLFTLSEADSTGFGTASPFIPDSGEWATRRVALPPSVVGGTMRVLFLSRNHFGQNFYLDNVRAGTQATNDVAVTGQIAPDDGGYVIETFPVVPAASFTNVGTASPLAPFPVTFEIRDSLDAPVYTSTKNIDTLAPGSSIDVTFDPLAAGLPAGHYDTRIIAQLPGDLLTANDTLTGGFTADLYVRTLPYAADFEGPDDAGWYGRKVSGSRNEWIRGTPAKPLQLTSAFDGSSAWITSLDSVYGDNQHAALYSPYFDLSAAGNATVLEFHQNFLIETGFDGALLEYSTNGGGTWRRADSTLGVPSGYNTEWSRAWYNYGGPTVTPNPPKWSGSSTAYASHASGWIRSTTPLGPLAGEPLVRFRWRFRTDESDGMEGWAVDAVRIFEDSLKLVQVPTGADWNLLSNPVNTPDNSVLQLFPGSLFLFAYGYSSGSGYVQSTTMDQGRGYWVKMLGAGIAEIEGEGVFEDTVALQPGWGLLGSLSLPVLLDSVVQDPPGHVAGDYFVYTPGGGYAPDPYLWPGQAAWVKSTGGNLILKGVWVKRPVSPPESPAPGNGWISTLKLVDAMGMERMLAFGGDYAEMPPAPPEGAFDVRIETSADAGGSRVTWRGATPPLKLVWTPGSQLAGSDLNLRFPSGEELLVRAGVETPIPATGSGTLIVTNPTLETIPLTYSLTQNYPNPFNPVTTIRFSLPSPSHVQLVVFDMLGREVMKLADDRFAAGHHSRTLDGTGLASGVYFYRVTAIPAGSGEPFTAVRSMVLVK